MDITPATKQLVQQVQQLKSQYTDAASVLFIDFYCQCKEGMDYLFPVSVKESIRLVDILQWFLDCVEQGKPNTLISLMWKDVVGPTLGEYLGDEKTERQLMAAFQGDVSSQLTHWDRVQLKDGQVWLILRELLDAIAQLEQAQLQLPL